MINSRRLFDGLMLVIVGAVLLMNTVGVLPWSIWFGIWRFWPLLLVAAGLSLVLNRAVPFMGLLCLALIAILTISWFWPQTIRLPWEFGNIRYTTRELANVSLQHTEVAKPLSTDVGKPFKADINFRAGKLNIGGTTDQAFNAKFDHYGDRPAVDMNADNNGTSLKINSIGNVSIPGWFTQDRGPWETWDIAFNPNVPLDLTADMAAGDVDMDLSQYNLTGLHLDMAAGDLKIDLGQKSASQKINIDASAGSVKLNVGNSAMVDIDVSAAAGSVDIQVPSGAALRIREHTSVSSSNVGSLGLTRDGDYWVSKDYDKAAQKVDIDFSGSAASLRIVH